jgi:NAD(P)H-hydrate repair Nnr-like enzyme with NAD(P)H-hydrate epimerase domain
MGALKLAWLFLRGKKTYIVGLLAVAYALGGLWDGSMDHAEAVTLIVDAVLGMTIRGGIKRAEWRQF